VLELTGVPPSSAASFWQFQQLVLYQTELPKIRRDKPRHYSSRPMPSLLLVPRLWLRRTSAMRVLKSRGIEGFEFQTLSIIKWATQEKEWPAPLLPAVQKYFRKKGVFFFLSGQSKLILC
jgi:hypothetical protein